MLGVTGELPFLMIFLLLLEIPKINRIFHTQHNVNIVNLFYFSSRIPMPNERLRATARTKKKCSEN